MEDMCGRTIRGRGVWAGEEADPTGTAVRISKAASRYSSELCSSLISKARADSLLERSAILCCYDARSTPDHED